MLYKLTDYVSLTYKLWYSQQEEYRIHAFKEENAQEKPKNNN